MIHGASDITSAFVMQSSELSKHTGGTRESGCPCPVHAGKMGLTDTHGFNQVVRTFFPYVYSKTCRHRNDSHGRSLLDF